MSAADWSAILEPFAEPEARILRRYAVRATDLGGSRYFREQERSLKGTVDRGQTTSWEMTLPDAESTRAIAPLIRELYSQGHRASFPRVARLITSHSKPGRTEALVTVETYANLVDAALTGWGFDAKESPDSAPSRALEDWLYGEHLHWEDKDQVKRVEENPFGLYEWQFHWVVERLSGLYFRFARDVVQPILEVPSLFRP